MADAPVAARGRGAYNAGMGSKQPSEIDAWLRAGGTVIAASERGARAVTAAYHRARRAEGLTAWAAPDVRDWHSFAQQEWEKRNRDARMVLNPLQEQALWAGIVKQVSPAAAHLEAPRQRLAAMAMEAHRLICSYAPQYLDAKSRSAWQQDAGAFSSWLAAFDELCRRRECVSQARLALELTDWLENDSAQRSELLLVGFDRILPVQLALFRAWGSWREAAPREPVQNVSFWQAADTREELAACALWCERELKANPQAKLLLVTQNEARQRGEIERALLRYARPECEAQTNAPFFEFSLGVPLMQTSLGRGALLTFKWLSRQIAENEIDWLLSTGQLAASDDETRTLTAHMRAIRRRNLQRPEWSLTEWITQRGAEVLPEAFTRRVVEAKRQLEEQIRSAHSPMNWSELAQRLLETAGWPGGRPLGSEEFQVTSRLERVLVDCASLGFDGATMQWPDFISALERASAESLFSPESHDAPILIAGPAQTAGLAVDGIWFLGVSDDAWPASGATQPFLPIHVQREARMPHGAAQFDWELAQTMTARLMASASQVNFSFAKQGENGEARPSRLITTQAADPRELPQELRPALSSEPAIEQWTDSSRVPFPGGKVRGGATVLTSQSQCPFKAFATSRLAAEGWEAAEAGLTARQRGQLLHDVLKLVWDPAHGGINSHAQLIAIPDLREFVAPRVGDAMAEAQRTSGWGWMPPRYLELEAVRLTNLVAEWLEYEKARVPFTVEETEMRRALHIEGIDLNVRIDRLDRLNDGKLLVIDYKSGNADPNQWDLPRPEDVQLPLYAGFALDKTEKLGGLVFAKIRAGELEFAGRIEDAKGTLRQKTSGNSNLVKKPLTLEQMIEWKEYIEKCAKDLMTGCAEVDPRDYPETCKYCALKPMCRIEELQEQSGTCGGDEGAYNG
jgi:ATP-dependent helicase/nuclease subunit B